METFRCFHFSTDGCKNTSKPKYFSNVVSSSSYAVLVWNKNCSSDFKPASTQTSQLENDVILYDIFCAIQPNASKMAFGSKKTWIPALTMSFCMKWSPLHNHIGLCDQRALLRPNGPNCVQSHVLAQLWHGHQISTPPFKLMWFLSLTSFSQALHSRSQRP